MNVSCPGNRTRRGPPPSIGPSQRAQARDPRPYELGRVQPGRGHRRTCAIRLCCVPPAVDRVVRAQGRNPVIAVAATRRGASGLRLADPADAAEGVAAVVAGSAARPQGSAAAQGEYRLAVLDEADAVRRVGAALRVGLARLPRPARPSAPRAAFRARPRPAPPDEPWTLPSPPPVACGPLGGGRGRARPHRTKGSSGHHSGCKARMTRLPGRCASRRALHGTDQDSLPRLRDLGGWVWAKRTDGPAEAGTLRVYEAVAGREHRWGAAVEVARGWR